MVHALSEIRRVLAASGVLIDLRPVQDRWQIEVVSAREVRETGRVQDSSTALEDDKAANRAMARVATDGWFLRDREEYFLYDYSWDAPSEMEEWIEEEWEDFLALDEETKRSTRSAWALGDADTRVRLRVKMLITRWNVVKDT